MAFYLDEEEVWKCPKHPSKRRRNGVCPVCLKDRLVILCPDCANVRPCACYASATSSSSSASSSFSLFSSSSGRIGGGGGCEGGCSAARVSNLIDSEPSFRRSRSVGIPFLRSRDKNSVDRKNQPNCNNNKMNRTPSFWSVFKLSTSKRYGDSENEESKSKSKSNSKLNINHDNINEVTDGRIEDFARMMKRSRSMSVVITSVSGTGDGNKSPAKSKGWHFPSPMKVFRQSKASKLFHERSPLYRG